jgi:penicillin-binding protein 1C
MIATRWQRSTFLVASAIITTLFAVLTLVLGIAQIGLEDVLAFDQVRNGQGASDLVVLDSNGELLEEQRVDFTKRRYPWLPLADFNETIKEVILAAEDRRFYHHSGWRLSGLLRAALYRGTAGGGSTITMQLANLVNPRLKRGNKFLYKVRQTLFARKLEALWSKEQILEAYLNLVPLRGEVIGVPTASRVWFNKHPKGLLPSESAIVAGFIPAPNQSIQSVQARIHRQAQCGNGDTSCREVDDSLAAVINAKSTKYTHFAPHLARRFSNSPSLIRSTIDGDLQRFVTGQAQAQVRSLIDQNVHDVAVVVVENKSGRVLAYVGNQEKLSSAPHVDGVKALRQAGSTLKPFLYATALEAKMLTAATELVDEPLDVTLPSGTYAPKNYDKSFHGVVSVRSALANSLNIPAVGTLKLVGTSVFSEKLKNYGFSHLREADHYGLSLALGSGQVSLEQLVQAYRVLANEGRSSNLCLQEPCSESKWKRVVSAEAAYIVADILADNNARSETFGYSSPLKVPFWAPVKTGTSRNMRDNWCVGFSRYYTVGVWVGNFNNQPMWDVSGVTGAAPLWAATIEWLHQHRIQQSMPNTQPSGIRSVAKGNGDYEYYIDGTEVVGISDLPMDHIPNSRARILYPSQNARLALDGGIPSESQKVMFSFKEASEVFVYLDGAYFADGADGILWSPQLGQHEIALVTKSGKAVDRRTFIVQG